MDKPPAIASTSHSWVRPDAAAAAQRLGVDPARGLDAAEVRQRLAQYGPNKLAEQAKEPGWKAFLRQYRDLMQIVLLLSIDQNLWVTLLFPGWVFIISVYILALNLRRQEAGA